MALPQYVGEFPSPDSGLTIVSEKPPTAIGIEKVPEAVSTVLNVAKERGPILAQMATDVALEGVLSKKQEEYLRGSRKMGKPIVPFEREGKIYEMMPFQSGKIGLDSTVRIEVERRGAVIFEVYETLAMATSGREKPRIRAEVTDPGIVLFAGIAQNSPNIILNPRLERLVYTLLNCDSAKIARELHVAEENLAVVFKGLEPKEPEAPKVRFRRHEMGEIVTIPTITPESVKEVDTGQPSQPEQPPKTAKAVTEVKAVPVSTPERVVEFGVAPILELTPIETKIATIDSATSKEGEPTLKTIVPFMGLDHGSEGESTVPPVLVIGYMVDGQVKESKRVREENGLSNDDILQGWQALQVLSQLPIVKHSTLYDVLHVVGKSIDNNSLRDTRSDMGKSVADFQQFIESISTQTLPEGDLEKIHRVLEENHASISPTALNVESEGKAGGRTSSRRRLSAPKKKTA